MTVPPGIPQALPPRAVAAALSLTTGQVRYLLDSEQIPSLPRDPHGQHRVTPSELIIYAAKSRLTIDWLAVLEVIN